MAVFFDNFDRANSATVDNGWTEEHAATFEILSNELKGTPDGTQYYDNQLTAPAGADFQDGYAIVEFYHDTGIEQVQVRDDGSNSFYIAYVQSTSMNLAKNIVTTLTNIATAASFGALTVGRKYRLELRADGSYIKASLWDAVDGVLIATLGGVDTAITASGNCVLAVGAGGNAIRYDNFTAIPMADANLVYNESFLDANNHIAHLTTGGTVAIATYKNSKKLKLSGASASAKDSFVEPSVPYTIVADMECPSTAVYTLQGLDVSNNVIFSVEMDGTKADPRGTFDTDNDATLPTFNWTAGTPKQIQVTIDPVGKTARCFYSNGTGSPGDTFPAVSAALSYTNVSIVQWKLTTNGASTGDCYLDEVKILRTGMAFIGDSITSGHALSAGGVAEWANNPNENSRGRTSETESHYLPYQYMLTDDGNHNPVWGFGRGIDGDESDDVDTRVIGDVVDPGATGAVVWVGTNDIQNTINNTLTQTKANTTSIIDKLQAGGIASSEIYLVECAPRLFNTSQRSIALKNADKDALNIWLYEEAQRQRCKIVQVHDALEGAANLLHANYDATDGVHLNTAGLKLVAEAIVAATVPPPKGALFSRHLRQLQTA